LPNSSTLKSSQLASFQRAAYLLLILSFEQLPGTELNMDSEKRDPFRAIIVGGGPSGLALAHCLHAAKIDYVVLEKRKAIVEFSGAGLGCKISTFG
jgi:hypothetical protein